ncbi:hypothetical protein COLO4_02203, partial [Corchorus olitorius]
HAAGGPVFALDVGDDDVDGARRAAQRFTRDARHFFDELPFLLNAAALEHLDMESRHGVSCLVNRFDSRGGCASRVSRDMKRRFYPVCATAPATRSRLRWRRHLRAALPHALPLPARARRPRRRQARESGSRMP